MFLFLEGKSVLRILKAQPEDLGIILALQYRAFRSEARLLGNERIPPLMQTLKDLEKEYREGIVLKAGRYPAHRETHGLAGKAGTGYRYPASGGR